MLNRAISIRSNNRSSGAGSSNSSSGRRGFSFASLRGSGNQELSRRLHRLIKSANNLVGAHEAAGRERVSIATQLSEWGEQTADEATSDVSDKVGVVLSELGEQEDAYAHALDDSRTVLKTIRNTEKSVQPSRDGKARVADDIARLKAKEPESARLVILEQELVRAEAENLVAEAQLTNITRQKLKESYEAEFRATIERAEKQAILAKHGLRLLRLLDDTPVVPGDERQVYTGQQHAQQILRDAEDDMRDWTFNEQDIEGGAASTSAKPVQDEDARIVSNNLRAANANAAANTSGAQSPLGTPATVTGALNGHRGSGDRASEATLSEPGSAILTEKAHIAEVGA